MVKKHLYFTILALGAFFFAADGNTGKDPCQEFCKSAKTCENPYFYLVCKKCAKKLEEVVWKACEKTYNDIHTDKRKPYNMSEAEFKQCNKDSCKDPTIRKNCDAASQYYARNIGDRSQREKMEDKLMKACGKAK